MEIVYESWSIHEAIDKIIDDAALENININRIILTNQEWKDAGFSDTETSRSYNSLNQSVMLVKNPRDGTTDR
jgi:hypothetical protein